MIERLPLRITVFGRIVIIELGYKDSICFILTLRYVTCKEFHAVIFLIISITYRLSISYLPFRL